MPGTRQHYAPLGVDHALDALLDTLELSMRLPLMLHVPPRREVGKKQLIVAVGEASPCCVQLAALQLVEGKNVDLPPARAACLLDRHKAQPVSQPFHAQCRGTAACGRPPGRVGGAAPSIHGGEQAVTARRVGLCRHAGAALGLAAVGLLRGTAVGLLRGKVERIRCRLHTGRCVARRIVMPR